MVELENFLKATTSYENQLLYTKAVFILEQFGLNSFEEDLMLIFNKLDMSTTEDNLEMIYNVINHYLELVAEELGVEFTETTTLSTKVEILEGLNSLPNYGDPTPIVSIGSTEMSPEEKLCLFLEEIGSIRSNYSFTVLQSVNPTLIENIVSLMEAKVEETSFEDLDYIRDRVRLFRTPEREKLMAFELIKDGLHLGLTTEFILDKICDGVCELEKNPSSLAEELFAVVLISNVEQDQIKDTVSELLEQYSSDVTFVTKGLLHLKKIGVIND